MATPTTVSTTEAARRAGITRAGLTTWLHRYPILGVKVAGRWRVDSDALARLLAGEQLPRRAS
jgi:hypothetical protein